MLSDKSVEILLLIKANKSNLIQDFDTFSYLENNGLIAYDGKKCAYVTPFGEEQLDNYYFHKDNLEIQKNNLNLSMTAKTSSLIANIISIIALVVAVIGNIPEIYNWIISLIK